VYGGGGVINSSGEGDGGVGNEKWCDERVDPVLDLLSDLYLLLNSISVGVSGLSSCPTLHCLLTTYATDYCPNQIVNYFDLRKLFYTRWSLKNVHVQIIRGYCSMRLLHKN